jgi:hypothetical protein
MDPVRVSAVAVGVLAALAVAGLLAQRCTQQCQLAVKINFLHGTAPGVHDVGIRSQSTRTPTRRFRHWGVKVWMAGNRGCSAQDVSSAHPFRQVLIMAFFCDCWLHHRILGKARAGSRTADIPMGRELLRP